MVLGGWGLGFGFEDALGFWRFGGGYFFRLFSLSPSPSICINTVKLLFISHFLRPSSTRIHIFRIKPSSPPRSHPQTPATVTNALHLSASWKVVAVKHWGSGYGLNWWVAVYGAGDAGSESCIGMLDMRVFQW